MNLISLNLSNIVVMNESFQVQQMGCYIKPVCDHQYILIVTYCHTSPMGTTEEHPVRSFGITQPLNLGVTQKLADEAFVRLHKELQNVLLPLCSGCYYEWMALKKGPEADRGNPQINVLLKFNFHCL